MPSMCRFSLKGPTLTHVMLSKLQGWQEWVWILESNEMDAEMESWQVDIYNDL